MAQKILPIGSIILYLQSRMMIAGYQIYNKDENLELGYILLPYPYGCMGEESYRMIPVKEEFTLIATGYESERSQPILQRMQDISEMTSQADPEEYLEALQGIDYLFQKILRSD